MGGTTTTTSAHPFMARITDAPQDRFRGGAPVPPTEVGAAPVDS
ncbi:hypothetical protein ACSR0Z_24290 [Streptomyces viridosporus]